MPDRASALLGVLWINDGWPVAGATLLAFLAGAAVGALYAALFDRVGMPPSLGARRRRLAANFPAGSWPWSGTWPRGVPWMLGLFVLLMVVMEHASTRAGGGRPMFAVGGNREAARRAGVNVRRVHASAFVLRSTLAALGGMLSAARRS